jgi:hypothetical protein
VEVDPSRESTGQGFAPHFGSRPAWPITRSTGGASSATGWAGPNPGSRAPSGKESNTTSRSSGEAAECRRGEVPGVDHDLLQGDRAGALPRHLDAARPAHALPGLAQGGQVGGDAGPPVLARLAASPWLGRRCQVDAHAPSDPLGQENSSCPANEATIGVRDRPAGRRGQADLTPRDQTPRRRPKPSNPRPHPCLGSARRNDGRGRRAVQ